MSDSTDTDEKDKKKKKNREEEQTYTGTKAPADRAFAEWINKQWKRGERIEKIEVIEYFPKGTMKGFGQPVDAEEFTKNHEVNMEEAVDLSNRFVGAAQINCDRVHKKEMSYYARAFDKGRQDANTAIDTFPIFLRPKTIYVDDGKTEGEEVTAQTLALDYLREGIKAYQFDRTREDNNVGDLIAMFLTERREERLREMKERTEQRQWENELQKMLRTLLMDWMQAIRDSADAAPRIEMAKAKADMLRTTLTAGKNLASYAFGSLMDKSSQQQQEKPPNGTNGESIVVTRMTQERMLLDNFFEDCKNAKIEIALFGELDKDDNGNIKIIRPGIFTPDQFLILAKVLKGYATAEALDDLMPAWEFPENAGKPLAITGEQLQKAQAIPGMSDAIASSLIQLVTVRKRKRTETTTAAPSNSSPSPVINQTPQGENSDV